MRQLAYTMFIANNYALLHLRRKEHLVKHYKFSNYYEDDCSNDAKKTVRHANTTRRITQNGNNRPDQTVFFRKILRWFTAKCKNHTPLCKSQRHIKLLWIFNKVLLDYNILNLTSIRLVKL